jgi:hypothetical protein
LIDDSIICSSQITPKVYYRYYGTPVGGQQSVYHVAPLPPDVHIHSGSASTIDELVQRVSASTNGSSIFSDTNNVSV